MNLYMKEIKQLLNCSDEFAQEVYWEMSIDFSECSNKQFKQEALFVASMLRGETTQEAV